MYPAVLVSVAGVGSIGEFVVVMVPCPFSIVEVWVCLVGRVAAFPVDVCSDWCAVYNCDSAWLLVGEKNVAVFHDRGSVRVLVPGDVYKMEGWLVYVQRVICSGVTKSSKAR